MGRTEAPVRWFIQEKHFVPENTPKWTWLTIYSGATYPECLGVTLSMLMKGKQKCEVRITSVTGKVALTFPLVCRVCGEPASAEGWCSEECKAFEKLGG